MVRSDRDPAVNLGYSLTNGRMLDTQQTTWTPDPPCYQDRFERELMIVGSDIFIVHRQYRTEVAEVNGQCEPLGPDPV